MMMFKSVGAVLVAVSVLEGSGFSVQSRSFLKRPLFGFRSRSSQSSALDMATATLEPIQASDLQGLEFPPQVTEPMSPSEKAELREERRAAMKPDWPLPKNTNVINALKGEEVEAVPVWMMRQAGRYLPEFRAVRAGSEFLKVCQDPGLASEVTVQPRRRYPELDACIIFSDILVVPQAMGQPLQMLPNRGPVFDWRLESPEDIKKLDLTPDVEDSLGYVFDAMYLTKKKVDNEVPIFGFCGAPWTILGYMVEGEGSRTWAETKRWLYDYPEESHKLLEAISRLSAKYLIGQWDSGAQMLQVFDTNAGVLPPHLYEEFGAKYMRMIADLVKAERPQALIVGFPKDMPLASFNDSSYDGIGLSWTADVQEMRERFPNKTLQGNMDAHILYANKDAIRKATHEMVKEFGKKRYVANLGHGMEPRMDPEHAKAFIQSIKEASSELE